MRLLFPLLLCVAAALSSAVITSPLLEVSVHFSNLWTKLILTQQWPNTFCSMEHCHPNLSYWTVHGLWPNKGNDCNSSWHFNSSEIEDLLPDMKKCWPDLLHPSSSQFWKYEWSKHGTCAAEAASLNSQHKYFSKALELYHKVDLNSMLTKLNIIPSDKYYTFSEIEEGIERFYGAKPKIQCVHPSKNSEPQILGQIEICFDADFTLQDCEKHFSTDSFSRGQWDHPLDVNKPSGLSVCAHDIPVYYPPVIPGYPHV
ncbi:ribonuclease T2 isoform X1 [Fundulus heteroclitus]|uniref:ribonuclease T2 isoform X1 n=1 Tax=Fundulus heteroclitus TaxID=8078 RepID=UPI00165B0C49|nr:ribonuclease T2 isoform X1 [Fundulus heteroclitus]XP_035992290.1 ribonuclease T2 isoform X1 [Fundulus heteroclitus]